MRVQFAFVCLALCYALTFGSSAFPMDSKKKDAAFTFSGVPYFHRFSKNEQHEYTPSGQEDLKAWKDMVTILYYPRVKDGEALAATASAVLENYKAAKGLVLRTASVPRTKDKPAEHLIAVVFGRPEFTEVAFARFRMHNGVGTSVVYSHRIYGEKTGNEMSAWLKKNGPATEKNLMKWDAMPKPRVRSDSTVLVPQAAPSYQVSAIS